MSNDPLLETMSQQTNRCQGKWNGECCCNCRWLIEVMKHPENPIGIGFGRVTEQMGYACTNPELQEENKRKIAIFFTKGHGICECWKKQD